MVFNSIIVVSFLSVTHFALNFSVLLSFSICGSDFEELAVGVLNECYQRDKNMAHRLLVRELRLWGNTTLMTIADSAEQMDFMGHTACQTKLNKIWKGKMALYTSTWKVCTYSQSYNVNPSFRVIKHHWHDIQSFQSYRGWGGKSWDCPDGSVLDDLDPPKVMCCAVFWDTIVSWGVQVLVIWSVRCHREVWQYFNAFFQILSALFLPFLIPLIKFSTNELHYGQRQEPERLTSDSSSANQIVPNNPGGDEPSKSGDRDVEFVPTQNTKKKKMLYQVELCACCKDTENINFWKALLYYHTAPVVKFSYHTVSVSECTYQMKTIDIWELLHWDIKAWWEMLQTEVKLCGAV